MQLTTSLTKPSLEKLFGMSSAFTWEEMNIPFFLEMNACMNMFECMCMCIHRYIRYVEKA